jgi:hypothetical protein
MNATDLQDLPRNVCTSKVKLFAVICVTTCNAFF